VRILRCQCATWVPWALTVCLLLYTKLHAVCSTDSAAAQFQRIDCPVHSIQYYSTVAPVQVYSPLQVALNCIDPDRFPKLQTQTITQETDKDYHSLCVAWHNGLPQQTSPDYELPILSQVTYTTAAALCSALNQGHGFLLQADTQLPKRPGCRGEATNSTALLNCDVVSLLLPMIYLVY
jgi:hypothetical protein